MIPMEPLTPSAVTDIVLLLLVYSLVVVLVVFAWLRRQQ